MAVIGAGAAGLAAAEMLSRNGARVVVLEARPRPGGRVLTRRARGWPVPIELGAEFVHGRSEEMFEIAGPAGLLIDRLADVHAQVTDSGWRRMHDFWTRFGRISRQMRASGRDRSIAEFLRSRRRMPTAQKWLLASIVEGYHAAPLDRASEHALSTAREPPGSPEERAQFRIVSGYDGVIRWLQSRIDSKRCRFLFSTVARVVRWKRGEVIVRTAEAGEFRARHAIITVPAGVLKARPEEQGGIRFEPEPRDHRRALERIEMGQVVKIILRFDAAIDGIIGSRLRPQKGGRDEIGFVHRRDATLPTWWTAAPAQVPMLTGWAGGPAAHALRNLPREEILKRAMETLGSSFEVSPQKFKRSLIAWHMHDWNADPYSRGAYSYQAVGGASAPAALARPVEGTLFFAGEATEEEESGTVPGAIASGRRAASLMLNPRTSRG